MPDKVYRTAIYCRLSREDGDKVESNSIASQRAICEDYIARQEDLELVCEPFVDEAVIIGLKPPSTNGRRFSPISITGHFPK